MSLPSGYKRLEYIQSSGTQYINTGFKPNNNTRVVMDLLYTGSESISNEFGAWNSSNNASFICLTTGKNNLYPFYGNTSKQVSANRTVRHTVDMDKNVVKMNGTTMITFDQMSFQCTYPMFLCCFNNVGATENMTSMRIYSCQIYDNGTIIRDYIPCQTAGGEIGLWDDVNSVFYGNAGTGTFTAGPEIDQYGNDEHTMLLLHGENLTDSSSYGCAVTASDMTISDTAKFGKSLGFNSSATMSVVLPINLSTADFTIDWWEYRNTDDADVSTIFTFGSKNVNTILGAYNESNRNIKLYASSAGSGWDVANGSIGTLVKNQWVHRAIVRTGGKIYAYQDGVLQNTFSGASKIYAPDNIITFSQCFGVGYLNGYIDEFRVSDIARWTENFTPPTAPYSKPVPSAPSNFNLASSTETTATLAWDAVDGATGYKLYRDDTLIATLTDTSYTDTIHPFTSYVYTLAAYNDNGESDPATISVQIIVPPKTPSNFRASSASMTAVALEWDSVAGADSYQLKRNGTVVYTGNFPSYTDSGLMAETPYTYSLTAVNTAGNSAETTLTATTTQFSLVTDRTAEDVYAQNVKGVYKAIDLIRVGEAVQYLAGILVRHGYSVSVSPKMDWKDTDWPTPSTMTRYLADVETLLSALKLPEETPAVPADMEKLTWQEANDIESILVVLDDMLRKMLSIVDAGWTVGMAYTGFYFKEEGT